MPSGALKCADNSVKPHIAIQQEVNALMQITEGLDLLLRDLRTEMAVKEDCGTEPLLSVMSFTEVLDRIPEMLMDRRNVCLDQIAELRRTLLG